MATRTEWKEAENRALITLYFEMLDCVHEQRSYNKAAMIRHASRYATGPGGTDRGPLANRSRGSIEAKLMNASAAHRDELRASGAEAGGVDATELTMDPYGYRCLGNYQSSLRDAMRAEMHRRQQLAFSRERQA